MSGNQQFFETITKVSCLLRFLIPSPPLCQDATINS